MGLPADRPALPPLRDPHPCPPPGSSGTDHLLVPELSGSPDDDLTWYASRRRGSCPIAKARTGAHHWRRDGPNGSLASTELYDIEHRTWVLGTPMRFARGAHTATLLEDGTVVVVGYAR